MTVLRLHGRPIVIERFKAMVSSVLKQAEDMLWEQLMYVSDHAERFAIPLESIQDDVTFTSRGYSFLSRPGNELGGGFEWIVQRLVRSHVGQKMRADGRWHHRHVRRYLRKVDRFLELLLFLVHTTGGQPARGTEITTARYQNGFLQDRNIFVMDGQIVFVSRYHKTQSLWDKPRVIPRFLPWRVSQLFGVFLAYVHPLSEHLVSHVTGRSWSDYVWASRNGPWETERLTRVVARETAIWLGCRLTTLEYRHAAITLGREFVGAQFGHGFREQVGEEAIEEPEMELESGLDLQAGRTEKIGVQTYGVPVDIVQHLSIRSVQFFRQLSEKWHSFLELPSSREQQEQQCTKRHQKPHRPPLVGHNGAEAKRSCDALEDEPRAPKHPRTGTFSATSAAPVHARTNLEDVAATDAELQLAMQKVLGQTQTSFRSAEQELAMMAILQGKSPLVVILPTGGGKSLLFMVPACLTDPGVTVVVVPFRALLNDLSDRLEKAGIEHIEWRGGQVNPAAIVLVSADFAGRWNFLTYASSLDQKGLLRRVVVDECHLTYTASHYRARLAQLKNLRFLSCPMVLMTATQPPMLEHELAEAMLVRGAQYIRASTVRLNTRYVVQTTPRSKLITTAVQICQRQVSCLRSSKGVVYCRSRDQCEEMAQNLGCGFYHAGMDAEDRADQVKRWVDNGRLIVATSALGTGVDYPGIVYVLHIGVPYGMIDFAQESGRAGRSGEAVDSVILVEKEEVERDEDASQSVDESVMRAFVRSKGCRRAIMSNYLDGREIDCGMQDCATCDRCGEGNVEWHRWQQREGREMHVVQEVLDELADGCAACWVTQQGEGDGDWFLHSRVECTAGRAELSINGCDNFRKGLRYAKDSQTCFKCGISQKLCNTRKSNKEKCQWTGVAVPILIAAMGGGEEGLRILRRCGFNGEQGNWNGYRKWLGLRHERRLWGENVSNSMAVLVSVILHVKESR